MLREKNRALAKNVEPNVANWSGSSNALYDLASTNSNNGLSDRLLVPILIMIIIIIMLPLQILRVRYSNAMIITLGVCVRVKVLRARE